MSEDITKTTDGYGARYGDPQPGGNDPKNDDSDLNDTGSNPYSSGAKWPTVVPGIGGDFGARNGIAGMCFIRACLASLATTPTHHPQRRATPTTRVSRRGAAARMNWGAEVASGFDNLYADAWKRSQPARPSRRRPAAQRRHP